MPGDKSISHRALILSALADGRAHLSGLNTGSDVVATAICLRRLGVEVEFRPDKAEAEVEGSGLTGLREPSDVLDVGNSGTSIRALAGVCAGIEGASVLTGDETLRRRPMLRVVEPLRKMGATIDGREGGRLPPLYVRGGPLRSLHHHSEVASAQVKTCLLLAGLRAGGRTSVTEPRMSRDHTERMLAAAGVEIKREGTTSSVSGGRSPAARDWEIPGDISSAFFLIVAAALVPGSDLTITGVGLNPTRIGGLEVLRDMGADVSWEIAKGEDVEPLGTIRARYSDLKGVSIAADAVPRLLDEVPALAVVATQAEGITEFNGIDELRLKESDRIRTIADGLRSLGVDVDVGPGSLRVEGRRTLSGGTVDAEGDHRVALSFAVASLIATDDVRISGWSAVGTSFPEFLDILAGVRSHR